MIDYLSYAPQLDECISYLPPKTRQVVEERIQTLTNEEIEHSVRSKLHTSHWELYKADPAFVLVNALEELLEIKEVLKKELMQIPTIGQERADDIIFMSGPFLIAWPSRVRKIIQQPQKLLLRKVYIPGRIYDSKNYENKKKLYSQESIQNLRAWIASWHPNMRHVQTADQTSWSNQDDSVTP